MCIAPAPNFINDLIVLAMLNAPPNPVSTSTRRGSEQVSVIRLTSVNTSSKEEIPKSGIPNDPAATPPPDR